MNLYEEILCFYIGGYINTSTFVDWLFEDDNLKKIEDDYLKSELISINFNNNNAVISIKNTLRSYLNKRYSIDVNLVNEGYCEKRAIEENKKGTTSTVFKELYSLFDKPRRDEIQIDVSSINSSRELQVLLMERLGFPNFYGMNWDAFWDAITGLVEMPEILKFKGWANIQRKLPRDAESMQYLLSELNRNYPNLCCKVIYSD